MRDCFILGCGRSGTSLAAGLLSQAGYFMGAELYPGDDGNPRGYFEDREINAINEGLLAQVIPGPRRSLTDKLTGRPRPVGRWFRWLAELRTDQVVRCPSKLTERIQAQVARRPFCFKDPRFSYTLGAWRKFAPKAAMLCVFRHPAASAASMVAEAARDELLVDGAPVDYARALRVWRAVYAYTLDVQRPVEGDWLFVHYEQLMDGATFPAIEQLLGVSVRGDFVDPNLRRSVTRDVIQPEVESLYRRLCALAGFNPDAPRA
jgi:hypothetical protein